MATIALPIRDLELRAVIAEAETERVEVEVCAKRRNSFAASRTWMSVRICWKAFVLAVHFARLSTIQNRTINMLVESDFSSLDESAIEEISASIDRIVSDERKMLEKAYSLNRKFQPLWSVSLKELNQQVDHMDSIAESLHMAADSECTALLSIAAEQVYSVRISSLTRDPVGTMHPEH